MKQTYFVVQEKLTGRFVNRLAIIDDEENKQIVFHTHSGMFGTTFFKTITPAKRLQSNLNARAKTAKLNKEFEIGTVVPATLGAGDHVFEYFPY